MKINKLIVCLMLAIGGNLFVHGATPASKLIARMNRLQALGMMIGHQDDPVYGHFWKWEEGRSDVKEVVGDYPAVMGFELGGIELGKDRDLDDVPFDRIRKEIVKQHERGGINEMSWHPYNPMTGEKAWDTSGFPVREILKEGIMQDKFLGWLDKVAQFIGSLKTADGKLVPVIFRPWHEMSGGWFWWGTKSCTAEEIKKLYQLTFDVLSKEYHLKNIVWAYSPNSGYDDFMKYYPGDQYVDLLGIDIYDFEADNNKYQSNLRKDLNLLQSLGKKHHKLIAITETGAQQLPDDQWFTKVFWPVVSQYPISYVLFWRNAWDNHKETYISYPGAPSEPDFKKFASFNRTLFVNDIKE